ncbi:hypothetical protein [Burkholderia mayonis]|uniref:hypothetical protein n=1 Tax=Burkholderia mayonis TaxID=1385591 RepID=UPI00131EEABB|nr:hypothetical protein [Burkholderia mayonis]
MKSGFVGLIPEFGNKIKLALLIGDRALAMTEIGAPGIVRSSRRTAEPAMRCRAAGCAQDLLLRTKFDAYGLRIHPNSKKYQSGV